MNTFEFPIIYGNVPIEGNTTSEFITNSEETRKVASIDINSNISIVTYNKNIQIKSICIVKEYGGQYQIQLCDEDEGEIILEVTINEELVDALKFAITQFNKTDPIIKP